VLSTLLEFVVAIYSGDRGEEYARLQFSPVDTVLYLANMSIQNNQSWLPFDQIL
jgi:hypothetical protein